MNYLNDLNNWSIEYLNYSNKFNYFWRSKLWKFKFFGGITILLSFVMIRLSQPSFAGVWVELDNIFFYPRFLGTKFLTLNFSEVQKFRSQTVSGTEIFSCDKQLKKWRCHFACLSVCLLVCHLILFGYVYSAMCIM